MLRKADIALILALSALLLTIFSATRQSSAGLVNPAVRLAESARPAESAGPAESATRAESVRPAEAAKHAKSAQLAESAEPTESAGKIKVFFHVAAQTCYRTLVMEKLERIIFSGLYDRAEVILCGVVGKSEEDVKGAVDFLTGFGSKVKVMASSSGKPEQKMFERFTLDMIKNYISPDDKFLYIHTKGATHCHPEDEAGGAWINSNVQYWSFFLDFFLIKQWKKCVKLLDFFDTVGVQLQTIPETHYAGNFWWARGSHYVRLDSVSTHNYFSSEFHVSKKEPLQASLGFQNFGGFYVYPVVPKYYVDDFQNETAWPAYGIKNTTVRFDFKVADYVKEIER